MNLIQPAALFLSILMPLIVLLYLLKLRRVERPVPSVYLWRRMVRDVEANAPWQRLKFNILLLLQLLFLAALIFSLARPYTQTQGISAPAAILVVDVSASMAAIDVSPSRLEAAKDEAIRIVEDLPDNAAVTLIAAGREARVLVSQSTDMRQVWQAIDSLQALPGGSDMGVALQLASAIAARQPGARVMVLSDGNVSLPERLAVQGRLDYLPFGISNENQAVSLLNLERAPDGTLTAFAQVTNYGGEATSRRIAFYADGQLLDSFDLELDPGGEQSVVASGVISGTQQVEARLLEPEAEADFLAWDDRAVTIFTPGAPVSVTLISPGNLFLETALALSPAVQTTQLNPSATELPASDLTIIDGALPVTATLPAGNLLFVGPLASTEFFSVTGQLTAPQPMAAESDDPLLRFVDLGTVSVLDSARIPLPEWARPVIFAGAGLEDDAADAGSPRSPLLFLGETGGRRVAVLAFDLRRSDLPLQVAFPLLFANLLDWLAPGRASALPQSVAPGDLLTLPLPPDSSGQITVRRPDGSTAALPASSGDSGPAVIAETGQLGVYRMELPDGRFLQYAVNLFSPQESRLAPAETLPGATSAVADSAGLAGEAQREWWRPLALLALALLCLEWLVYHRPALKRIQQAVGSPPPGTGK